MADLQAAQLRRSPSRARDDAVRDRRSSVPGPQNGFLALQGSAGNRAVAHLVAGQAAAPSVAHPAVIQRDATSDPGEIEIFNGDGKHKPTDAKYAAGIGRADAARLRKAGTLSDAYRQEVDAKLSYFEGAGYQAYVNLVKPARQRSW